jgi:hypothetical protein
MLKKMILPKNYKVESSITYFLSTYIIRGNTASTETLELAVKNEGVVLSFHIRFH